MYLHFGQDCSHTLGIFEDLADWVSQEAINIYILIKMIHIVILGGVEMLYILALKILFYSPRSSCYWKEWGERYNEAIKGCGLNSTETANLSGFRDLGLS